MRNRKFRLNESSIKLSNLMARCLVSPQNLTIEDLEFMSKYSFGDLVVKFDLGEFEAHCLTNNLKQQLQRLMAQNISFPNQMNEVKRIIRESHDMNHLLDTFLDAFSDLEQDVQDAPAHGRMLDYGNSKSDSEEGQMIRSSLNSINRASAELYEALNDHDDIPQWCHYKVAQAEMMISKVRDYLVYKIDNLD